MIIKILGTGCASCKKAKAVAKQAVKELGLQAQVLEITDIPTIMGYGVMSTPGIVINEKVVGVGLPSQAQMVKLLRQVAA